MSKRKDKVRINKTIHAKKLFRKIFFFSVEKYCNQSMTETDYLLHCWRVLSSVFFQNDNGWQYANPSKNNNYSNIIFFTGCHRDISI